MVKEFRIELTPPPQLGYVVNSDVTGHVLLVTDEAKSGYKAIEITLKGYGNVRWSETHGSGDDRRTETYHSHEVYIANTAVLWSKDTSPGGNLESGSYQFPFSLKFQANGPLPSTFVGPCGKIVYEVEAVIVKTAALKFNKKFSVQLPFSPVVDPKLTPEALEPKILQVQKTLCCLCCASGPILLTARIPRTGFCIGIDAIPFEVDLENGSNRRVKELRASLVKQVIYFAQGHRHMNVWNIAVLNSDTPIQPGTTTSWKPAPFSVPNTEPVITASKIIQLNYYFKVQACMDYAINPHVEFALLLGNVPVSGVEGQPLPPSAPPAAAPYPAPVPTQTTPYPPDPVPYPAAPYPQPAPPSAAFAPPPPYSGLPPGFVDPIKR